MPSLRSSASSAPRSPLARAASAAFTMRSFSAAEYWRRFFGGTLSTAAPLTLRRFSAASAAGSSRPGTGVGFGTSGDPFSALRYRDIQGRLSHATLAQRARPRLLGERRLEA